MLWPRPVKLLAPSIIWAVMMALAVLGNHHGPLPIEPLPWWFNFYDGYEARPINPAIDSQSLNFGIVPESYSPNFRRAIARHPLNSDPREFTIDMVKTHPGSLVRIRLVRVSWSRPREVYCGYLIASGEVTEISPAIDTPCEGRRPV